MGKREGLQGTFQITSAQSNASASKSAGGMSLDRKCRPLATSSASWIACSWNGGFRMLVSVVVVAMLPGSLVSWGV